MDYQRLIDELKEQQSHLDNQTQQVIALDRKLNYARKMLETERKARREAEEDKAQLVSQKSEILCEKVIDNIEKKGRKTRISSDTFAE